VDGKLPVAALVAANWCSSMPIARSRPSGKRAANSPAAYKSQVGRDPGAPAYFIGIWDAVVAIGWQRFFPDWAYDRHFPSDIQYARHLQSIDEGRKDFKRVPWEGKGTVKWPERDGEPEHFDQIWFAGNHADIGEASRKQVATSGQHPRLDVGIHTDKIPEAGSVIIGSNLLRLYPSAEGMMHDECMVGVGGTAFKWAKAVRDVPDTAHLHDTVYERLAMKSVRNFTSFGPYRPVALKNHVRRRHISKQRGRWNEHRWDVFAD
jgi:Uncharacterized alpha/beta hydrolase domain (DUF2235)